MLSFNVLVGLGLAYVTFLFLVAFAAERGARRGQMSWLRSPWVYTLSLSVYCTGWTFYGAVGYAARSGLEFATIYLGPTIVMIGWFAILRKLVRIGRAQRITSIADLISSRYGKSNFLGALVTVLAVIGMTPYIALQLQSVALSFAVFSPAVIERGEVVFGDLQANAIWVAAGLTLFTVVFGTRNLDVNERHTGVVAAIAVEAVVKLLALMAVGIFVVWGVAGGPGDIFRIIEASPISDWNMQPDRWVTLTFLSGAAFLCLPRMFHVLVVENSNEGHLTTASWAFPLYLFLISLFVVPIAAVGLAVMPEGANPDLYVLTVPLAFNQDWLAILSFLGGFSAATSMVIVASIALSIMVSNNIVLPIWLSRKTGGATVSGDVRKLVLFSRRISIAAMLALGYFYFRLSGGGEALAAIGLIAFVGLAQVLPAMMGGIFWRGATRVGAAAGLGIGFSVWLYALFLPSFGPPVVSEAMMSSGPWGIEWLRPHALLGFAGIDPLVHAVIWSLSLNTVAFVTGSLLSFPLPIERLQGAAFVNVYRYSDATRGWGQSTAEAEDLLMMSQRIIGASQAQALFESEALQQGLRGFLPDVTPEFLERLERELSGSVGAATAHAMVGQITGGAAVSVEDLMRVADETQQMIEYSSQLELKSDELTRTARQLREANDKLTALSAQKDAFLSQISHELRTPMTSIRAFSEILMSAERMNAEERLKYAGIIHDETLRLTRLLDALLDLSVLENGQVQLDLEETTLKFVIDRAISATRSRGAGMTLKIERDEAEEDVEIRTDCDRLAQVFINLLANAQKYAEAETPKMTIRGECRGAALTVDFIDNGPGIPKASQDMIFEKFTRLSDQRAAGSAGLGLAISREIMERLGGSITYLPGQTGGAFRVMIPLEHAKAA